MTSSYKATGHASVRATPAGPGTVSGAWMLNELTLPVHTQPRTITEERPAAPQPVIDPAVAAAERAALIDQGYARGLADGMQKGMAAAQTQVAEALTVLAAATAQMEEVGSLAPAILEENIAALSVTIARQILAREINTSKELVTDLVRRALTEFPIDQPVRIRVHPVDLSLLTAAGASPDGSPITGNRDASWMADPRVVRGGCLVEGRDRIVDGRVDTALERIYRRITKTDAT